MFKHQMKDQQQRQRDRWRDDEESNSSSSYRSKEVWGHNTTPYSAQPLSKQQPQQPQPQRAFQSKPQPKKDESFQLEQRLLDDILQPTGISVRPSDHLLNEFYKRAKNLDRDKIFNGILDKLKNYTAYITNQESVKMLTKCLYLVDHLVQNRLEDIYEAFEERTELFMSIKESYPTNKKINEICSNIVNAYGGAQGNEGGMPTKEENLLQSNNDNLLLDIDYQEPEAFKPNENGTNLLIQNVQQQKGNSTNLLEDLFNINPNSNGTQQKMNAEIAETKPTQSKGFAFIKSKSGDDQKAQSAFIKPKTSPLQSDLDTIFFTPPSSNSNSTPLGNIADNSQSTSTAPIDLTKITFTPPPQEPKFNYDHVYKNTDVLKKEKDEKDPFNFVNDMIKSKK